MEEDSKKCQFFIWSIKRIKKWQWITKKYYKKRKIKDKKSTKYI